MYKKTFFSFFFLILFLYSGNIEMFSQSNNDFEKQYDFYKQRFYDNFIYETENGFIQSSNIPIEYRQIRRDGKTMAYWADGVWWLGHYVGMLALEYERFKLTNQDTSLTIKRLKAALETYLRLDYAAEKCWGSDSFALILNGFYLRDDIPADAKSIFKVDIILSDYVQHCNKEESKGNAPSQDQAWASYIGLALVNKLVGDTTVLRLSKEVATLLLMGMQGETIDGKKTWQVVNPVTREIIQKKGDIQWLQFAHASIGTYLTGEDMNLEKTNRKHWKNMWDLLQNNFLIDKYGHFNWYGMMSLSAVLNEWGSGSKNGYDWLVKKSQRIVKKRPDLQQPIMFPHLPLVNVILHGYHGKKNLDASYYEDYFQSLPEQGAFRVTKNDTLVTSSPPWHSLSLFCPWQLKSIGEFNMLDFLFLYNAYWIVYESDLPQFESFCKKIPHLDTDKVPIK